MSETKRNEWKCEACDASFYFRDDLLKHNVGAHGAALGVQLRNSKEVKTKRYKGMVGEITWIVHVRKDGKRTYERLN